MSSTSAVAVLAQGLRDLRDFAEGPDDAELRERTGLGREQIDTALAGEQLPTREVTLALVGAWEGDVEAWDAYWTQIAELVRGEGEQGAGKKRVVPVAPEPSIITSLPVEEPEQVVAAEGAEGAEAASAEEVADAEGAGDAAEVEQPEEPEQPEAATDESPGGGEARQEAAEDAELPQNQEAVASDAAVPVVQQEPAETVVAAPVAEQAFVPGLGAEPPKKSLVVRVGVPVALFVVGVGVGAFGDHALNSKDTSKPVSAVLPPASQGSSTSAGPTSHSSAAASASGSGSSSAVVAPTGSGTSGTSSSSASESGESSSSTSRGSSGGSASSSGSTLGAYSGIQLASGYSVDFLNDTYHPTSGTANGPDSMGFFATSFVDGKFYADRVAILDPQESGSYTACLNDTRYQHDVLLSQVSAGSGFCIHTDTGHLVLVTVRRMPSSTDANPYAVVDLTVWQN